MIDRWIATLAFVACFGLSQPFAVAAPGAANSVKKPAVPTNASDNQIERTMRAKLAKSKLSADHFTFSVAQGVVTIEGTTNVMQHKGVMTRMARASGAVAVRNNIRISDAAKAKAVENLSKVQETKTPAPKSATASLPVNNTGPTPATPAPIPRATVLPPKTN